MTSLSRPPRLDATNDEPLDRFSPAERALHWATAAAVLTCAVTGLVLYVGPLSSLVGRRNLLKDIHVIAGLSMPVPLILAYLGRWRDAVRADIGRLSRWTRADRRWLWTRGLEGAERVGKFNAGQKANAAFIAGMIPVMLASGSIMRWFEPFPLEWRTGATFVHDWTAIATWLIVAGHIAFALADSGSLRGMITGQVTRRWAEDRHPRWASEVSPTGDLSGDGRDPRPAPRSSRWVARPEEDDAMNTGWDPRRGERRREEQEWPG
ncbi:MAG TPA: cytochrome b/b6 domain-containing protein [Acidimicrobiales bacterium]